MGPADLAQVLRGLQPAHDPNLLVGYDLSDDAGVYRISADMALVQTVDLFTPIVDDPYEYGQIAAANALSDVYAMGARPLTALNIAAFPRQILPFEVLGEILRGGFDKAAEAETALVGGHTVENAEPLYGLAVTGLVHPDRVTTNAGAQPGDVLVLTKPLGTGIVSTAIKREACPHEIARAAIESMKQLNRLACEAMTEIGIPAAVRACTDITGFGLLGHTAEMARASGVRIEIEAAAVPVLPGAEELAQAGFVTGGATRNAAHLGDFIAWHGALPDWRRHVLFDPQTSGGLLVAVAPQSAGDFMRALQYRGIAGAIVGQVQAGEAGLLVRA